MMGAYKIDTTEDIHLFSERISSEFISLAKERAWLRNRLRRMHESAAMLSAKEQITTISEKIKKLRRQMFLCEVIALRSEAMEYVVNQIDNPERQKTQYEKESEDKKR